MATLVAIRVPKGKGAMSAKEKAALRPDLVPPPPVMPNG